MRLGLGLGLTRQSSVAAPVELVTNGTFDVDANWTKALGATISGGTANLASATAFSAFLSQSIPIVSGGSYTLVYTISGLSAGGVLPNIGTPGNQTFTTRTANGTYTQTIVATGNFTIFQFSTNGSGFTGSIDNVSLKRTG